jgi:hypothetical protein
MPMLRMNRGIAIVYVMLFLMVLGLLFVALGIDVGLLAFARSQGQAATDAAALRAAAAIPHYNSGGNTSEIENMATGINSNNTVLNQSADIAGNDIELCNGNPNDTPNCLPGAGTYPTPAAGVKVTKTYSIPLFFARRLSETNNVDITVSSTAWLGGAAGLYPTLPVVLCGQELGIDFYKSDSCEPYSTKFTPDGVDNSGYWFGYGESTDSDVCKARVNGTQQVPYLGVGYQIELKNGQDNNCHKAIEKRFQGCDVDACNGGGIPNANGKTAQDCTAFVPIVNCPKTINNQETVAGFAAMCITEVNSKSSDKYIAANRVCGATGPNSFGGGPDFGVYAERPVLVK